MVCQPVGTQTASVTGRGERGSIAVITLLMTSLLGLITIALGYGAYVQKDQDLETANATLKTTQEQLVVSRENVKVAGGQLKAREEEIERLRQGSIDPATVSIDSARKLMEAAKDSNARQIILQSFARKLRNDSERQSPLQPFSKRLFPGIHESSTFLSGVLKKFPMQVDLSGIDLHGHYWRGAQLDGILLRDADLRAVDLSDGSLKRMSLQGAVMQCANLQNSDMRRAHLDDVDLSFANVRGADLSDVTGLTIDRLTGADYNDQTQFPDTVDRRQLAPPQTYRDARTCAKRQFHNAPSQSPPEASGAPSTTPSVDSGLSPSPSSPTPPVDTGASPPRS